MTHRLFRTLSLSTLLCAASVLNAAESPNRQAELLAANYQLTALEQLAATMADPADRAYWLGRVALGHYRRDEAATHADQCGKAARNAPQRSRCAELSGEALGLTIAMISSDMERLRLARLMGTALQRAIKDDPSNGRAQQLLARYYRAAPWLLGGNKQRADDVIKGLVKVWPDRAAEVRGIDAADAGDWARAARELTPSNGAAASSPTARYYLALAHQNSGRDQDAVHVLRQLTTECPEFFDAWFQLGVLLTEQAPADAITTLRHFVERAPDAGAKRLANAWYQMGLAYEAQRQPPQALQAYQTALTHKRGHNESQAAVRRLTTSNRR